MAEKLCRRCGKPASSGHNYCSECYKLWLAEQGVDCVICGFRFVPQNPKFYLCMACADLWDGRRISYEERIAAAETIIAETFVTASEEVVGFEKVAALDAFEEGKVNLAVAYARRAKMKLQAHEDLSRMVGAIQALPVHFRNHLTELLETVRSQVRENKLSEAMRSFDRLEMLIEETERRIESERLTAKRSGAAERLRQTLGVPKGSLESEHARQENAEVAARVISRSREAVLM